MVRLSQSDLQFLARFATTPDALVLKRIYAAYLVDAEKDLRVLEGAALHQAQGRAQQLDQLIADLDEAKVRLNHSETLASRPTRRVVNSENEPYRSLS
jgi:hypothetical protein